MRDKFAKPSQKGNHVAVSASGIEPGDSGIAKATQVNLDQEADGVTTMGFSFKSSDGVTSHPFFDKTGDPLTGSALCSFFGCRLQDRP